MSKICIYLTVIFYSQYKILFIYEIYKLVKIYNQLINLNTQNYIQKQQHNLSQMIQMNSYQDTTPSVYFNFDNSNQKIKEINNCGDDNSSVPYDYSCTASKFQLTGIKVQDDKDIENKFVTPPSHMAGQINFVNYSGVQQHVARPNNQEQCNSKCKKYEAICVKLNTQQFFDDFDTNFVVNFGESPTKMEQIPQFRKTFQSCPGVTTKQQMGSKIDSYISEPMFRRNSSMEAPEQQNQEDIINSKHPITEREDKLLNVEKNQDKQNVVMQNLECKRKQSKLNCEIRKRVLFKNSQKITNKVSKKEGRPQSNIINPQNLMIITSSCRDGWTTDIPQNKKTIGQINSQPIKTVNHKSLKKAESNIFSTRQIFKQTLKSTTLDNWKKKFIIQKQQLDQKQKSKTHNIFHKPFAIIR